MKIEGCIKYVVNVETCQEDHPWNAYLNAKWGDTMIIYHSLQGQQRREYINSAPTGFEWSIYDPDKNEYYSKWHTMDTVFYYNCGSSYTSLNHLDVDSTKTINNQTYPSVKMILENPGNGELTEQKFFYDESLKIDANL